MSRNYISTKNMTRESWLEARHKGIGSSDIAAALGLSRYKTQYDLWIEKVGQPEDLQANDYLRQKLRAGLAMEPVIAQLFEEDTGYKTREDHKIRIHPEHRFLLANCDRMIVSNNGRGPGLYEIKNVGNWTYKSWETNETGEKDIPLEYWLQVQHQLLVTGYAWGMFGVFIDGYLLKVWEVQPDYEYHKTMIKGATEFWKYVTTDTPPPAQNAKDVEKIFPKHESGKYVEATDATYKELVRYHDLSDEKKLLEVELDEIKDALKGIIGEAEGVRRGNLTLATWKSQTQRRADTDKLKKANLFDQYSKEISFRKLDIKKLEV